MKSYKAIVGLSWLVILLLSGCAVDKEIQNELIIDVDDDFRIRLLENLETRALDLVWVLESIRNPECSGDTLVADVNQFGSALRVDVELVRQVGNCLPATRTIQTEATTGPLDIGQIPLNINFQELVPNRGALLVGDRDFQVEMETTHGFYLPYKRLQRIPQDLVWGYVGFGSVYRQFAQEFLDGLAKITTSQDLNPGSYGYFEISSDQEITVLGQEKEPFNSQAFYGFYNAGDLDDIQALIREYQEEFPGMRFYAINSYGKVLAE
jgi:hypothetical protein